MHAHLSVRYQDKEGDERQYRKHGESDLDPALWIFSRDDAGVAVDHDLKILRAVILSEEPERHEDVLESLAGIIGVHPQISLGIARDLARAEACHQSINSTL